LSEVGEDARFAEGDLVGDEEKRGFGEHAMDFFGSGERACGLGEFGGGELIGSGLVVRTERCAVGGETAAAGSVGFGERAGGAFEFHFRNSLGVGTRGVFGRCVIRWDIGQASNQ
jgi:hypothetical protein